MTMPGMPPGMPPVDPKAAMEAMQGVMKNPAFMQMAEKLGTQYAQDFDKIVRKYALGGTPDQCRARLQEYIDAGAKFVVLSSACPDDYLDTNIELIARELVAPMRG